MTVVGEPYNADAIFKEIAKELGRDTEELLPLNDDFLTRPGGPK